MIKIKIYLVLYGKLKNIKRIGKERLKNLILRNINRKNLTLCLVKEKKIK